MTKRKKTAPKRIDEKIFQRTASKTKKINVEPSNMRGGIRLWNFLKPRQKKKSKNLKNK